MNSTPDFVRDPRQMRGSNHNGMRQFNERIVLQAIRHHGAIAKADIARLTQLSTQTVSIIVDRLLGDDLLIRQERVRGRIGQPSIPFSLNPQGAFSIGLQVGRRSLEVLVCDFLGQPRHNLQYHYPFPDPDVVLPNIERGLAEIQVALGAQWDRVVGVGMASPLSMHRWGDLMGPSTHGAMARWESIDLSAAVQAQTRLPVDFAKDTTAACLAEMLQGRGRLVESFLYVFVGTFVGGGLVTAGHLMAGQRNNAAAIGSMPTAMGHACGKPAQLLQLASGWQLEQTLQAAGHDPLLVHSDAVMDAAYAPWVQPWLQQASQALAMTAISATALMDLDAIVIDGSLGRSLINELIAQTRLRLDDYNLDGLQEPAVVAGSVGPHARALGGALLPLHTQFFPLKDIFLKEDLA